jgi:uncharacterized protein YdeI (YjbR/CyaY-like superfamily)
MQPTFFDSAPAFRAWLEQNHETAAELYVGFHKKESGLGGLTKAEAIDEALCFGWIDGIIHRIDAQSYCHRFTPRRPGSNWSNVNLAHVRRLHSAGKMHPAGLAAHAARKADRTGLYSFENRKTAKLPPAMQRQFKSAKKAWAFFSIQAPSYQRISAHWVITAKQAATREARLAKLIKASAAGRRLF